MTDQTESRESNIINIDNIITGNIIEANNV